MNGSAKSEEPVHGQTLSDIVAIGIDADDTLWHNESLYSLTQEKFKVLLADSHNPEWIEQRLYETDRVCRDN